MGKGLCREGGLLPGYLSRNFPWCRYWLSADHAAHEGVGCDVEGGDVARLGPGRVEDLAVEVDVVGLSGGEGREVVFPR
jgi:hypothetical protein